MNHQNCQQIKDDDKRNGVQSFVSQEKMDLHQGTLDEKLALPNDEAVPPATILEESAQEEARKANDGSDTHSNALYTTFSKYEKWFITAMASLASFFSPLSGQIYYPVMPTLVQSYHLTTSMINLSITTYMILQGLAPSFMATFADASGRRPAYILAFTIYTAANIGLALQNSYAALMVLRCLQSAGSSGTVSFGYGVIADVATSAERGKYIGPMAAGVMIAPGLGPVIGGLLAQYLGWRSVFWFLTITSGMYLLVYIIFMPETARNVVGDGRVPPKDWWRMSLIQFLAARRQRKRMTDEEREDLERTQSALQERKMRGKLALPNPRQSFTILLEKDALIIVTYSGLQMFAILAVLTSTPNFFNQLYGLNELEIGLCFLPLGIGASIGAIINGKLLDCFYRRTAHKLGRSVDRRRKEDLRDFPIEKARLHFWSFLILAVGVVALIPYGWVLRRKAPLAVPLVMQFIMGFAFTASSNTLNTLLIDLFPDCPSTAAAASNLVRCWLGALGAGVIDLMMTGMGWGWCFIFLGLMLALGITLVWAEREYGMRWRTKRLEALEERAHAGERKQPKQDAQLSQGVGYM